MPSRMAMAEKQPIGTRVIGCLEVDCFIPVRTGRRGGFHGWRRSEATINIHHKSDLVDNYRLTGETVTNDESGINGFLNSLDDDLKNYNAIFRNMPTIVEVKSAIVEAWQDMRRMLDALPAD